MSDDGDIVREALESLYATPSADMTLQEFDAALAALARLEAAERENAILRGLTARLMPCRYCGVEDMAKCPSGFPGCGLGDDLLIGDEAMTLMWAEKIRTAEAQRDALTEALRRSETRPRDADYIARTISTVRNHREADNCWPQWANIFADEIERYWAELDRVRAALAEAGLT